MKRDLLGEFEKIRNEMVRKGIELGFQHPLVLELSRELDIIHNEILKREEEKAYRRDNPQDNSVFEKRSSYHLFVCAS
ncbi:aspartyl-phosphate phosphatase Spo0E family protein [Tepidibacillus marianensis]|uniref:aspartyl-phosphate phosphatase Spo0E family protein n=1 Tax=Tepidibacillus marianensis TaxID=3131995 RepID=UPI0030D48507